MTFDDYLQTWIAQESVSTDDVLAAFLPLVREVIETHRAGFVAPLEGIGDLHVDQTRVWYEEAKRASVRDNNSNLHAVEQPARLSVEVLAEGNRTTDVGDGNGKLSRAEIGTRGAEIVRPVYLPGYVAWEHELGHHDPLTDIYSLGMLLASLACQLNLNEPADLEAFVTHRRNLFELNARLHPAIAQAILRMTELDRHKRAQDLSTLLRNLEHYRDQTISLDIDLARIPGFRTRDVQSKQQVVLSKLRDRLFDTSRRNNLLQFRPTMQSINLTQASMPLVLNIQNIREDQVLIWDKTLRAQIVDGSPISLNKYLNFSDALYLPSLLERIMADARRDQNEYGFAQLRLAVCFLSWANLKERPIEQYVSPLALLPVRLIKNKGVRDTYSMDPLTSEAEVNPVLRHQFRQLYNIELPETIDLSTTRLETLFEFLSAKIQASEPAVSLNLLDRPRIDLIHEKAKRRLDQYRRSARVSGRGIRQFGNLDYSYDPANFHPLGIKLFSAQVRTPTSRLREIIEERPRPRSFVTPEAEENTVEVERSFYHLRESVEANPYLWNFDLCNLTLANFHYRRMSLVRDYEEILESNVSHASFEATFSLAPRSLRQELPEALPLQQRFDVVNCDPTQATAIAEARRGTNYIIQGPPGTGKSQTITNLIADFIARGKRVLFVCEKRAAIDVVYARLRQCGLGSLCALIHDSQSDKKEFVLDLKQTYEQFLAEDAANGKGSRRTSPAATNRLQQHLVPLERFEAFMEAATPEIADVSVRQFLDRCVELSSQLPTLSAAEMEGLPLDREWRPHAERLAALDQAIRGLEPSGILARHPLRRLLPSLAACDRPMEHVATLSQQALRAHQDLVKVLQSSGIPSDQWKTLRQLRELVDYMHQASKLASQGNLSLVDQSSPRAQEFRAAAEKVRQAEGSLATARESTTGWREKLSKGDVQTAIDRVGQWDGKVFAWLSLDWWRMRSVLARRYAFESHAVRPSWLQVLAALQREYEAQSVVEQENNTVRAKFGIQEPLADFERRVGSLRDQLPRFSEGLRAIHVALVKSPKAESFVQRVLAAEQPFEALSATLANLLTGFEEQTLDELRHELTAVANGVHQVPQIVGILGELEHLPQSISDMLRQREYTLQQAEAATTQRTWAKVLGSHRDLEPFDSRARSRAAKLVETSYDRWLAANAKEVCHRVRKTFLDHVRISNLAAAQLKPDQREFKRRYSLGRRALEHEFGKSMRFKAIRELVDGDTALVIHDLKPAWLMSPLSVSDTLPLSADLFDVVIFDEASQVPLEESVPTIFRGRQTIIVGDEMQLPPTDFFSSKQVDDEGDVVVEENGQRFNYDLDSDSLLNHAARSLPSTMLGWHYRSRSEALISFSNWAFYDGRLLTVPDHRLPTAGEAPVSETGPKSPLVAGADLLLSRPLSFHWLRGAVYDQRRNRDEANCIAQLVAGILKRGTGLSVGVIAFSEAQQSEIEAALNRLAQDDDDFRALYDEELEREVDGQFVGLLVKNLENIQGDERDVVILSICYGPGPNGRMLMNFGPINQSGGEKRLNVAFSRAKQFMAVVSSIQYTAISNDYNDGANCLKNYLRYAEAVSQGAAGAAQRVLNALAPRTDSEVTVEPGQVDSVCRQLTAALHERGYAVDCNIGQSHFRVDLAVRKAGDVDYRLGILVDSVRAYEQSDALEREMMRPRLLRTFGWRLASVLAKEWLVSPESELKRIVELIEGQADTVMEQDVPDDEPDNEGPLEPVDVVESLFDATAHDESRGAAVDEPALDLAYEPQAENAAMGSDGLDQVRDKTSNATPSVSVDGEIRRLFEMCNEKSSKFWEITVRGNEVTVRFGRIGSLGQAQTKWFSDVLAANGEAERLISQKTRKGYLEVTG